MDNTKISKETLEWYLNQAESRKYELLTKVTEINKLIINQLLNDEVEEKAGEKYSRERPNDGRYSRWTSNPGSVKLGEEKLRIEVPRLLDKEDGKVISTAAYQKLKRIETPSEKLVKKIILGLSQKDYETVTRNSLESFGLSQSSVSREFIEESGRILKEFEERDLGDKDFIAIVLDGKHIAKEQIVIALGITSEGIKIPLGFIQTTTENTESVKGLLKDIIGRNFRFTDGLLAITDGSKGLIKAVEKVFAGYVVMQRCQWHKRENVISYLKEEEKKKIKEKINRAYNEPFYETARSRLIEIKNELYNINRSAARSLEEGLEETLALHKLGLYEELGRSFTTTNTIENLNSQLVKYIRKVKYWRKDMKARWVAVALTEIEQKMRRVDNYQKLYLLRTALKSVLKMEQEMLG